MYVEKVPNRNSPPAILLRESYREGKRVLKRTLANLTDWPVHLVEGLRTLLQGGTAIKDFEESFDIVRSLPHGHVAAVLGTLRKLGLERLIAPKRSPERDRVVAVIIARLLYPRSKLGTARGLGEESAATSLGEALEVESAQAEDLYAAMDWLQARQGEIERKLAEQHLHDGALVLYDVSSTYFEGAVHLPAWAIPVTGSEINCRSSLVFYAIAKAVPSPWRSSRAIPPIRRRSVPKSRSCARALG